MVQVEKHFTSHPRPERAPWLDRCGSDSGLSCCCLKDQSVPTPCHTDGLSDAIQSEIAKTSKQWWRDHGYAFVKKAVKEYNSELLSDIEMAEAIHKEESGIHGPQATTRDNLRQLVDQEPRESQLLTTPSDAVLNEVTTCREQFGELEQRLVGAERELRLMQESLESCELAMQTHFEHVSGWSERMTELETHREEIQSAHVSHVQEREAMRQVIARDLINLARDGVRTKEDLESYQWATSL